MTTINDYDYILINTEFNDNSNNIIYENVVLYDSRLLEYQEELLFCLTENTLIVNFDFYNDTYDIIQNKLLEVSKINNISLKNISLFQHNEDEINYYFINNTEHILEDVLIQDPSLNSWDSFKSFYLFLNDELGIINFDMLQCKIYSNNDWNTVFNYLEINHFNTNIRSSDDNTGHVMFDGDWVLESSTPNTELIDLYFNERITDIDIILGVDTANKTNVFISKDQLSLYIAGTSYNDAFTGFTTKKYFVKVLLYNNSNTNLNVLNENEKILHVTCHNTNYFFTTSDNRGFVFGTNTKRMLGINNTNESYVQVYPTEIMFDEANVLSNKKIKQITCSLVAYLILFYDGTIYAAGKNEKRELGSVPSEDSYNNTFKELTSFTYQNTDEYAIRISSGEYYTVVISNYGNVYSCGTNDNGRTAKSTNNGNSYFGLCTYNNALLENETPTNIFTQKQSFFVLTNQNNIYSSGSNDKGQLGIGNTTNKNKLFRVSLPSSITSIKKLFVCFKSSFIRDQDDDYYSLGQGAKYLTLMNNTNNRTSWVTTNKNIYSLLNNSHAAYIQGRSQNATAINENGEVFSWGYSGTQKVMGANLNNNVTKSSPVRTYISSTSNSSNYFTDALYGVEHSQGLTDDELDQLNNYTGTDTDTENYVFNYDTSFNTTTDNSGNIVFHIETDTSYNSEVNFVLSRGVYKITDISNTTPIALLNKDVSNIYYDGTELVSTTNDPSGNQYKFYGGTLFIYVEGDFSGNISLYSTDASHGYMGTQNKILYSDSSTLLNEVLNTTTSYTISDISNDTTIDITYDFSNNLSLGIPDVNSIIYTNSSYNITTPGYFNIYYELPRYYFTVTSNVLDNLYINGETNYSITHNAVTYYKNSVNFRVKGDLSMNIHLLIYDTITETDLSYTNFIYYDENCETTTKTTLINNIVYYAGYKNFTYQPYDYTISGNEIMYTISAELLYGNAKTHSSMNEKNTDLHYNTGDNYGYNASSFIHVLVDKTTSNIFNLSDNTAGTFIIDNGSYSFDVSTNSYAYWSANQDFFAEIGKIGNTESHVFRKNNVPYFNSNYTLNWFSGGSTSIYSDHFALCHDYPLTEDSVIFPVHYIWNGNNHSTSKAGFVTFYSHNTTHITSTSLRHYDWNEKLKSTSLKNNTNVYLYKLYFDSYTLAFPTYNTIPFTIIEDRFITIKGFDLIDFDSDFDSSNYTEDIYGIQTNITYKINIPSGKSLSVYSDIDISYLNYGGINPSTSTITINNETLNLYDTILYLKVSPDISSNANIQFYDQSSNLLTHYDILINSDYDEITVDSSTNITYDLSVNASIEFNYYEDTSYGLIPYILDNSYNITNNIVYSKNVFNVNVSNSYTISNIPSLYPITILNGGNVNNINITGDSSKSSTLDISNITYTFYYGDVSINVYDENYTNVGDTHMLYSSFNGGVEIGNIYIEDASFQPITDSSQNNVNTSNYLLSVPSFTGHDDVSAVSMIDVSTSLFNYMFSVELDVSNIELIDSSMTNLKFSINPPLTDISHLNVTSGKLFEDISFSYSSVKSGYASGSYIDQRIFKDVIRKISNEYTGSTSTADMFTNESQMVEYVQATDVSLCSNFNDIITNISSQGFKTITEYQQLTNNNGKKFYGMAHTLLAFILDASGDFPAPYNTLKTNIENSYSNNNNTLPIRVPYHFSQGQFITVRMTYKPEENVNFQFSPINYKCFIRLV